MPPCNNDEYNVCLSPDSGPASAQLEPLLLVTRFDSFLRHHKPSEDSLNFSSMHIVTWLVIVTAWSTVFGSLAPWLSQKDSYGMLKLLRRPMALMLNGFQHLPASWVLLMLRTYRPLLMAR